VIDFVGVAAPTNWTLFHLFVLSALCFVLCQS
jgi:hypothetical protein